MPKSFSPVADERSRILILGTMPGAESRKAGFYYAHPRNRFWQVIAAICDRPLPQSVDDKTRLILDNHLALWDVLESCEITNSADSSIRNPVYNDISAFIRSRPIEKILCNGAKAYEFCKKLELPLRVLRMPSTSPANAAWSLERLRAVWMSQLTESDADAELN